MKKSNNVIAIIGATATGKSDLAIQLAKHFSTEIISADSRLVYKDFNIGTAKPTPEELLSIKHHCVDVISPLDDFSVSNFKELANNAMNNIFTQNKPIIIAGGTGFYVKSLLEGLTIPKVEANESFRTKMKAIAQQKGNEFLHNMLKEKDKEISEKLHPNDVFRVIRALEVIEQTGKKMSELQQKNKPDYNTTYIFLNSENRQNLYDKINNRVEVMLKNGLVEEVDNLITKYGKTISLLKTLGYKEVVSYFDKEISFEEMKELIKKNTRNFAKRQLTWFRAIENTNNVFIDEKSKEQIFNEAKNICLSTML